MKRKENFLLDINIILIKMISRDDWFDHSNEILEQLIAEMFLEI